MPGKTFEDRLLPAFFFIIIICFCVIVFLARETRNLQGRNNVPASSISYVFICKKLPPIGQLDWGNWLNKNGQCSLGGQVYNAR